MIIYNVTVNIDHDAHDAWVAWMQQEHIPEVMATGHFLESRMCQVMADDEGGKTYAIQYTAADMEQYERYRDTHASRLQAAANERFGGRFAAFRTLLHVVHAHAMGNTDATREA